MAKVAPGHVYLCHFVGDSSNNSHSLFDTNTAFEKCKAAGARFDPESLYL